MFETKVYKNITIYTDAPTDDMEQTNSYVEATVEDGSFKRKKALLITDDEFKNQFTIAFLNLTDEEKENMFKLLDAELHDEIETNAYLQRKVIGLQIQNDRLREEVAVDDIPYIDSFDGEYDFVAM